VIIVPAKATAATIIAIVESDMVRKFKDLACTLVLDEVTSAWLRLSRSRKKSISQDVRVGKDVGSKWRSVNNIAPYYNGDCVTPLLSFSLTRRSGVASSKPQSHGGMAVNIDAATR
jgi:hypothetical protein